MKNEIKVLDVVALAEDIPDKHLFRGQVGTIVEILDGNNFEVEFSDNSGSTYALLSLHKNQIIHLHYEPVNV